MWGPAGCPAPPARLAPALLLGPPEAMLGEDRGSGIRQLTGQVSSRDERPPSPEAEPRIPGAWPGGGGSPGPRLLLAPRLATGDVSALLRASVLPRQP